MSIAWLARGGAAPAVAQSTVSVVIVGFVDVYGAADPTCPICDGEYDDADEAYAMDRPMGALSFVIRDGDGEVMVAGTTETLGGLQTASVDVAWPDEGERYEIVLTAPPDGWQLCAEDSPTRTFGAADIVLDSVREDFRFFDACPNQSVEPTATPTSRRTNPPPPSPSPSPEGPAPIASATPTAQTAEERGAGDDGRADDTDDGDDRTDDQAYARHGGQLGRAEGVVFIDRDEDAVRDPGEPGLNDVAVRLHGGGLALQHITDGTGRFGWDALGAGTYDVWIDPGDEWYVTTPRRQRARVHGGSAPYLGFGMIRHSARAVEGTGSAPAAAPPIPGAYQEEIPLPRLPETGSAVPDLSGWPWPAATVLLGLAAACGFMRERFASTQDHNAVDQGGWSG